MALALFLCWDFSSWQVTTSPVGRWVTRTAESVVLTDCPPGPVERNTSTLISRGIDLNLHLLGLRKDRHRHGGGVNSPLGLGCRNPLDPVGPAFIFEPAVDPLAPESWPPLP